MTRLACIEPRIEMSAIGSVCVVVKVPVAAGQMRPGRRCWEDRDTCRGSPHRETPPRPIWAGGGGRPIRWSATLVVRPPTPTLVHASPNGNRQCVRLRVRLIQRAESIEHLFCMMPAWTRGDGECTRPGARASETGFARSGGCRRMKSTRPCWHGKLRRSLVGCYLATSATGARRLTGSRADIASNRARGAPGCTGPVRR